MVLLYLCLSSRMDVHCVLIVSSSSYLHTNTTCVLAFVTVTATVLEKQHCICEVKLFYFYFFGLKAKDQVIRSQGRHDKNFWYCFLLPLLLSTVF